MVNAQPASVVFRLDASALIGSGHLMRCLALAGAVAQLGGRCAFLVRPMHPAWRARIEVQGHEVLELPAADGAASEDGAPAHAAWLGTSQRQDVLDCQAALQGRQSSWLVVDHYALDARWEQAMRPHTGRILVIDDLADRCHAADVLLDQNFHAPGTERYAGLLPASCVSLLGPRYALLRPEFRGAQPHRAAAGTAVSRVLVCFGGAAVFDLNRRALQALAGTRAFDVTLIAAPAQHDALRQAAPANLRLSLLSHSDRMAELMREHEVAVGAGGGMLWERFSQGIPGVAFGIADNQAAGLRSVLEAGLVGGHPQIGALSDDGLRAVLYAAIVGDDARRGQSQRSQALVDGRGAERVARRLAAPALQFLPAQMADAERLFAWRNHPAVRAYSHDPRPLAFAAHQAWLAAVLEDPQRCLLIAQAGGAPAGVLRFDIDDAEAVISVYLVPDRLGQGLGPVLIEQGVAWLRAQRPAVARIRADIYEANQASLSSFEAAGFRPFAHTLIRTQEAS